MSFYCHFGVIFSVILVSMKAVVETFSKLNFDEFSNNFRWILNNFSTFQCHIGVILVSYWCHFGVNEGGG